MADDVYRVEFYGLTQDEALRILDAVAKTVGAFGNQLLRNGQVVLSGNPKIPAHAQR